MITFILLKPHIRKIDHQNNLLTFLRHKIDTLYFIIQASLNFKYLRPICPQNYKITNDKFKHFFKHLKHDFTVGEDINTCYPLWIFRISNPLDNNLLYITPCE